MEVGVDEGCEFSVLRVRGRNLVAAATTRYTLALEGQRETQKSSGLWISTAVGSSAGILAAGGLQVDTERTDCQYLVREPLDKVMNTFYQLKKGFFTCGENSLVIENRCEKALLALDGQHGRIELSWGDQVTFHYASPMTLAALAPAQKLHFTPATQ